MSIICSFEDLGAHEKFVCGPKFGGIPGALVLKTGHNITDFSNAAQVQAAITAGTAVLVMGIKAAIPDATAVEGEAPTSCGTETVLDGFDRTITWKDAKISNSNNEFYRQLNSQGGFSGIVLYYCSDNSVEVIEKRVNFAALPASSPESQKEKRFYNVTAKWYQDADDSFGEFFDAPEGIFV
jgi:hypothetical protein